MHTTTYHPAVRCPRGHLHRFAAAVFLLFLTGTPSAYPEAGQAPRAGVDLRTVGAAPQTWPKTVSVLKKMSSDIWSPSGTKLGQATYFPGQELKLVEIRDGKLVLSMGSMTSVIAPEETNFWQRYEERQQQIASEEKVAAAAGASNAATAASAGGPVGTPTGAAKAPIGASSSASLAKRTIERDSSSEITSVAGRYCRVLQTAPSTIASTPLCSKPAYFELLVGETKLPVIADFSQISQAKLYIDLKGNGKLKEVQPLTAGNLSRGSTDYGRYEFGPLALDAGGKKGVPFRLQVTKYPDRANSPMDGYIRVVPAEYYTASLMLNGKPTDIALIDANYDGKFEPGFRKEYLQGLRSSSNPTPAYDYIAVDWNNDRHFDYRSEILPLTPVLALRQKYYEITATGCSSVRATETQPQAGEIASSCPFAELVIVSELCVALLDANQQGHWKVPAGDYFVSHFRLHSEKSGKDTFLYGNQIGSALQNLTVNAGQKLPVTIGEPLTGKFDVSWNGGGGTASIGLALAGAGGETYEAAVMTGGQREAAPTLKILSKSGRTLESGAFSYG